MPNEKYVRVSDEVHSELVRRAKKTDSTISTVVGKGLNTLQILDIIATAEDEVKRLVSEIGGFEFDLGNQVELRIAAAIKRRSKGLADFDQQILDLGRPQ